MMSKLEILREQILSQNPTEEQKDAIFADELEFLLRLRGEIQWPSPEALKAQIFKDVARAKRFFRLVR